MTDIIGHKIHLASLLVGATILPKVQTSRLSFPSCMNRQYLWCNQFAGKAFSLTVGTKAASPSTCGA